MNIKSLLALLPLIAGIALTLWGCKDDTTGTDPIEIVFPDSNISYGRYVQPLFDRGCAFSGCHAGDAAPDGLELDSYQGALSSDLGVISPGDTAHSRIIWRIEGSHNLARMPPSPRAALTTNQIKGIRRWILEGAQNN